MAGASFKLNGMGAMEKAFGKAGRHLANSLALTETIGEQLVSSTIERFETETAPDGTKWKSSHRAENEGGQTLTDGGGLKGSIAYEATPSLVAVGSSKIYAAIHQFGGEITPKSAKALAFKVGEQDVFAQKVEIPAREYIGINEDDIEEARETIQAFIAGGFR